MLSKSHVAFYLAWLGAFAAVELPAVFSSEKGDTFSEMLWKFQDSGSLPFFLVSGFAGWLFLHFTLKRFR